MKRHSGRQTGQAKRLPQRISGPPNWTWNSDSECRELFLPWISLWPLSGWPRSRVARFSAPL